MKLKPSFYEGYYSTKYKIPKGNNSYVKDDESYYIGYEDAYEDIKKNGWWEEECPDEAETKPKKKDPCTICKKELQEEMDKKEEELQAEIDKREKIIAKREAQLKKAQEDLKAEQTKLEEEKARLEEERKRIEAERRMLNEEIIGGSDISEVL